MDAIGHNDTITWASLATLPRSVADASRYFGALRAHGVTCLRLMLEYAEGDNHFFECPVGRFNPRIIIVWDQLFRLAEHHGLRFLVTPLDTF